MKQLKHLLNIKLLTILYILFVIGINVFNYLYPPEFKIAPIDHIGILPFFDVVLYGPIIEEIIFRYWAFGKNIKLQFSILHCFIIYILLTIFQPSKFIIVPFIENNIYYRNYIIDSFIFIVGIIVYLIIKQNKSMIPVFFTKFIKSKLTFALIVFLFAAVHFVDKPIDIYYLYEYIEAIIVSYLLTKNAQLFGLKYSILLHMLLNTLAFSSNAIFLHNAKNSLESKQQLIAYSSLSLIFLIMYVFNISKAKYYTTFTKKLS